MAKGCYINVSIILKTISRINCNDTFYRFVDIKYTQIAHVFVQIYECAHADKQHFKIYT